MNAKNCRNANNTSLQQQDLPSLRRRPLFHRQDSPHSVAALHLEEQADIDIVTKPTGPSAAMHIAVESSSSTSVMEDSLSSIVNNHLMTKREDKAPTDASNNELEQKDVESHQLNCFDNEQSTAAPNELEQQESQADSEILVAERSTFAPHKSCLKKSPSPSHDNSNATSKRSVHFYETVAIGSIPTLDEYSQAELASLYFSNEEEQALRSRTKSIIRTLCATSSLPYPDQHNVDNDKYCPRGLENYLLPREQKHARRVLTKEHIYSIIEAQHIMKTEGEGQSVDDNALAMISLRSSQGFREVAVERAAQDEAEVKLMLLQQSKAHMAAEAEVQQQRMVAVRRASMTKNGTPVTTTSSSRSYSPTLGRNNGSARAACA